MQQLAQLPGFDVFTAAELGQLDELACRVCQPAGSILFTEGEVHPRLYFICHGTVRLDMARHHRGRQALLSLGPGDLLAWSSLTAEPVMTATAITLSDCELIAFDSRALQAAMDDNIALGYKMMCIIARGLSRRLLATRLQLLDVYKT